MISGLILNRVSASKDCTMGVLIGRDGLPICVTLENPWLENEPFISCIPEGEYQCEIIDSPKFGKVYEVKDVPGRSKILFHKGNREKDTSGCVLVGRSFSGIGDDPAIHASRNAFQHFHSVMADKPFKLTITSALYQL